MAWFKSKIFTSWKGHFDQKKVDGFSSHLGGGSEPFFFEGFPYLCCGDGAKRICRYKSRPLLGIHEQSCRHPELVGDEEPGAVGHMVETPDRYMFHLETRVLGSEQAHFLEYDCWSKHALKSLNHYSKRNKHLNMHFILILNVACITSFRQYRSAYTDHTERTPDSWPRHASRH